MARIRTIKPDFWRNEGLSSISAEACLLAVGLLNICDDEGYFRLIPKLIEADIFPLRELSGSTTGLLRELSEIGYIAVFSDDDGKLYGQVVNFVKHQVINKPTPSKIKELCKLPYDYGSPPVALPTGKEGKGKELGKENEKPARVPRAPREARFDPLEFLENLGVPNQVAADWIALRKGKRAAITETAVNGIEAEARKAGMTLSDALRVCCSKGWAGFEAAWMSTNVTGETAYQRNMRERVNELTGLNNPPPVPFDKTFGRVIDACPTDFLD